MSIFTVGHIWKGNDIKSWFRRNQIGILAIFILVAMLSGILMWKVMGNKMKYECDHCSKNGRFECVE